MSAAAEKHMEFLRGVDEWFRAVRSRYRDRMQCGRGCALCCYGLFDVSLADAHLAAEALSALPSETRSRVVERAQVLQSRILDVAPELEPPYLLHGIPEEKIDAIVEHVQPAPCVFLGPNQECLIYERRPLACRLEGVPMIDVNDGLFGDWCELNFKSGVPESDCPGLALDYGELQRMEGPVTIFLPSAVVCSRQ